MIEVLFQSYFVMENQRKLKQQQKFMQNREEGGAGVIKREEEGGCSWESTNNCITSG